MIIVLLSFVGDKKETKAAGSYQAFGIFEWFFFLKHSYTVTTFLLRHGVHRTRK